MKKRHGITDRYNKAANKKDLVISIYDNRNTKNETWDRYTVFIGSEVYGMSDNALQPNGFNQCIGTIIDIEKGSHLGRKIKFDDLPKEVKRAICARLESQYGGWKYDKVSTK